MIEETNRKSRERLRRLSRQAIFSSQGIFKAALRFGRLVSI
jgi:hypothetical protein